MYKKTFVVLSVLAFAVFVFLKIHPTVFQSSEITTTTHNYVQKPRTKTSSCVANGILQDTACTPGSIFASTTKEQICIKGYASSVRDVSTSEKDEVYAEYSIAMHTAGQYEVDHLISLELGGSNYIANLWPESADPNPGFHEKDKYENYLHTQVCNGAVSLSEAQYNISSDWLRYYKLSNQ
jgi:hypothetical protein